MNHAEPAPSPRTALRQGLVLVARLTPEELDVVDRGLRLRGRLSSTLGELLTVAAECDDEQRLRLVHAVGRAQVAAPPEGPRGNRYGNAGLLDALRRCAQHYGRKPTVRGYMDWQSKERAAGRSAPHYRSFCAAFGTWKKALAEAFAA